MPGPTDITLGVAPVVWYKCDWCNWYGVFEEDVPDKYKMVDLAPNVWTKVSPVPLSRRATMAAK